MQVQFGNKTFVKTKFDGLDGKVVVAFTSEDEKVMSRATSAHVSFELKAEASEHQEVADMIHTMGQLIDATWQEHQRLKKGASSKIIR